MSTISVNATLAGAAAIPSSSSIAAAGKKASSFDHATLVFNVDVFLLCFVALCFLATVPRAIVRFTQLSEWTEGHLLYYAPIKRPTRSHRPRPSTMMITSPSRAFLSSTSAGPSTPGHFMGTFPSEKGTGFLETDPFAYRGKSDLHRNASTSSQSKLLRSMSTASGHIRRAVQKFPKHMSSWTTVFPALSWLTRIHIRQGLTIGGASILLAYIIAMLYAGLYKANPFTQPLRAGYVAISQMPVVVVLATKNNVIGALVGAAYTRINFAHRFAGRLFVLAINVHSIGYFYSWSIAGTFAAHWAKTSFRSGFVALIAADVLVVFSISSIRKRFYGTFMVVHVLAVVVLFIATYVHSEESGPYILCAVGAYMLDRLIRLVKTRYTTARLTAIPELGMTRIEVHGVNAGWRAGQHVRIRVLSGALGFFGWGECHPFTIASVSKSPSGEGLVLMCKKAGNWTSRLYDLARRAEYDDVSGVSRDVRILIEGPYGGPGHTVYSSFSGALVVAGGSGITYALGCVQDMIQKDLEGRSRLKAIELVWAVQDPSAVLPMLPLFRALLQLSSSKSYYATLNISLNYTRCTTQPSETLMKALSSLPPGLTVTPGRPRLNSTLAIVVDRACALFHGGREDRGRPAGVLVGVCGPVSLAEEVRRAVRGVEPERRRRVGGVELHDEVFGH